MDKQKHILKEQLLCKNFIFFCFITEVKYTPIKIRIEAIIIVKLIVSDFVNIAKTMPIIGCKYIKTATSVEVILLKAYPFKK